MKTLVISLLRLGDIITITPILEGLRKQGDEVHLLIHDTFQSVVEILPQVHGIHFFPRSATQEEIRDLSSGSWSSVDRVVSLLEELESVEFDRVINLTHTRQSGQIVGALPVETKLGLEVDGQGEARVYGSWFQFLDKRNQENGTLFHHVDLFKHALGIRPTALGLSLRESRAAQAKAEQIFRISGASRIAVQVSTSDDKKNWDLKSWERVFRYLVTLRSNTELVVMGAPSEQIALGSWVEDLQAMGLPVHFEVLSLAEAFAVCRQADLVITLDTSIKHIAAATQTPILEVALGSGNFRELGTYRDKSWIVASRVECYPCRHSEACTKSSHLCAQRLPPEMLAVTAHKIIAKAYADLRVLAQEYADVVNLYEVLHLEDEGWMVHDLSHKPSAHFVLGLLGRLAWTLKLDDRHQGRIPEYGSCALRIARIAKKCFPSFDSSAWSTVLNVAAYDLERQAVESATLLRRLRKALAQSHDLHEARQQMVGDLQSRHILMDERHSQNDYGSTVRHLLGFRDQSDFAHLRRISQEVNYLSERLEAERRMLNTLRERMMER